MTLSMSKQNFTRRWPDERLHPADRYDFGCVVCRLCRRAGMGPAIFAFAEPCARRNPPPRSAAILVPLKLAFDGSAERKSPRIWGPMTPPAGQCAIAWLPVSKG